MANSASPSVAQRFLRLISRGEIVTYGGVALLLLLIAGAIAVYLVKFDYNLTMQRLITIAVRLKTH